MLLSKLCPVYYQYIDIMAPTADYITNKSHSTTVKHNSLQNSLQLQQFITSLQSYFIAPTNPVTQHDINKLIYILRPVEYNEIIETRNADNLCGYIQCTQYINKHVARAKYRLNLSKQIVYNNTSSYIYCCTEHELHTLNILTQLNDKPLYERQIAQQILCNNIQPAVDTTQNNQFLSHTNTSNINTTVPPPIINIVERSVNSCSESLDQTYAEYKQQQKQQGHEVDEVMLSSISSNNTSSTRSNTDIQSTITPSTDDTTVEVDDSIDNTSSIPATTLPIVGMLSYDDTVPIDEQEVELLPIEQNSNIESISIEKQLADQLLNIATDNAINKQSHNTAAAATSSSNAPHSQSSTQQFNKLGTLTKRRNSKATNKNNNASTNTTQSTKYTTPLNSQYYTPDDLAERIESRIEHVHTSDYQPQQLNRNEWSELKSTYSVVHEMLDWLTSWSTQSTADMLATHNHHHHNNSKQPNTNNNDTATVLHIKYIATVYSTLHIQYRCTDELQSLINTFHIDRLPELSQLNWLLLNTVLLYSLSKSQLDGAQWFPSLNSDIMKQWCNKLNVTTNNIQTLHNALLNPIV